MRINNIFLYLCRKSKLMETQMQEPVYISHLKRKEDKPSEWLFQSNEDHTEGVSSLCESFADAFEMGRWGRLLGELHDKGKEQDAFQKHIRFSSGYDCSVRVPAEHSHAYVGGLLCQHFSNIVSELIQNPLMGHHRGLYDYCDSSFLELKNKSIPTDVIIPKKIENPLLPQWMKSGCIKPYDFHHIQRMLYSCLVDADFLDTEKFMQPEENSLRGGKANLEELLPKLNSFLTQFANAPQTEVNVIRNQVQQKCYEKSANMPGFYSLTVPTGGGKTISSLVWAINHAIKNKKKRIIIVIPYTSIIVQTASILKKIFGEDNVLEHHSNVDPEKISDETLRKQLKLASENWDYPIVVTTNVQLFESMMASHSSDCRKLHNICNSVIIIDEAQTLPTDFLQPIVNTLDTYKRLFGISVLFTTASQPVLSGVHQGSNALVKFVGLEKIEEIIPDEMNLVNRLKRVEIETDETAKTYDEIASELTKQEKVLCIVNTRRDARELFERLPDEGIKIHLSRTMCAAHISQKIEEMREAITNPANKIVRVISTQLIEAGVDIDFPVVYRQEAGLDSILQAAGRCNREGKMGICKTFVFSLAKEHILPPGYLSKTNNARKNMSKGQDLFSSGAMTDYFKQLYSRVESFDKKGDNKDLIKYYLENPRQTMFESAARDFKLIDENTTTVLVDWGNNRSLIEELKESGPTYSLMKKISQYSVNVRDRDLNKLRENGIIEQIVDGIYSTTSDQYYDKDLGLITENKIIDDTLII